MYRRFSLLPLIGLLAGSAHSFTGPYVGGDVGFVIFTGKHFYTDSVGKNQVNFTQAGVLYGGHIGYMAELGKSTALVGVEMYYNKDTATVNGDLKGGNPQVKVGTFKIKNNKNWGGAILAGKQINANFAAYLKLAVEHAVYDFTYKNSTMTPTTKLFTRGNTALVPGVGVKVKVKEGILFKHDKILIGGEYQYAGFFPNIKIDVKGQNISYELDRTTHRAMVNLSYMY